VQLEGSSDGARGTLRQAAKAAANAFALVVALPAIVSFRLRSVVIGRDRALEGSTQALAWLPGLVGRYVRRAFLRFAIDYCDPSATVEFGTIFSQAGARIDANAYIGPGCHIGLVHVERDVLVAAGVHIPSGGATHDFSDLTVPIRLQQHHRSLVRIGAGSWIGSATVVMADVGHDTVVGAGSVVTRPLPDYAVAAGAPARVIRLRTENPAEAPAQARLSPPAQTRVS
jgi:acetyltransferase-like isoleucine patch superfamily enzyme